MKLNRLFLLLCLLVPGLVQAVDRVVQENGPTGTYASISSAVIAAADGDRIVIHNRMGGLAWVEDVTVAKSLTFVSAVAGQRYLVAGNYLIAPSTGGKEIRFVGMENQSGGFRATSGAPTGVRCKVFIVDVLLNGNINFDQSNYDITVANSDLVGNITIAFGGIYGNDVEGYVELLSVSDIPSNNISRVIGNQINASGWSYGLRNSSSDHFFHFLNNFVTGGSDGIAVSGIKPSGLEDNLIVNNSVYTQDGIMVFATGAAGGKLYVENNAVERAGSFSGSDGIYVNSGAAYYHYVGYNQVASRYATPLTLGGAAAGTATNVVQSNLFLQLTDGSVYGTGVVDGGNPDPAYYDHDLTPNNPGAHGGSYSIVNHFPRSANPGPAVFFVKSPRVQFQGMNIDVEAIGADR